jgi:hypothetical protein
LSIGSSEIGCESARNVFGRSRRDNALHGIVTLRSQVDNSVVKERWKSGEEKVAPW